MTATNRLLYGAIMVLAVVVAWLLLRKRQFKMELDFHQRSGLAYAGFVGAMLGAKAPFLLEADWDSIGNSTLWLSDGKTILGGIFGGYLSIEIAKWVMGIHQKTGDSYAIPLAAAIAIGRLACFVAGCCYGTTTTLPWGCYFPLAQDPPGTHRHPTQLYEVAFHLSALFLLWIAEQRGWLVHQRLKAYLMAYLIYRFATEWVRPEPILAAGLTGYQFACIVLWILLAALWVRDRENPSVDSSIDLRT
ncbi:MAG: prolipoprotein diacylglyceryl transferase [Pirellula sp.]